VDVLGPIVLPVTNICAITFSLMMLLVVVKTVGFCYAVKIRVCVTGIVIHVTFLTASIVSKGAVIICEIFDAPTKCQKCAKVLDDCPNCGY
jgi:hypothetical protein